MTGPARRLVVMVSGPPGAGKTTIAVPLAAELGFALLAKDRIKETLHDWLGLEADLAWSQRLGAAAMELLWALAADAPAVLIEANFWPDDPRVTARLAGLTALLAEVHCVCPTDECRRRYAERVSSRHRVHAVGDEVRLSEQAFARCARPVGFGPVITVDTTRPVDVGALAERVRGELGLPVSGEPGLPVRPGMSEGTVSLS